MFKFKVKPSSKKSIEKTLNLYVNNIVKPINKANTQIARDLIKTARKNLAANHTDNTGRLRASIAILDRKQGGLFLEVGSGVEYAIDIEEGTKPHGLDSIEFASLMDWVGKKLKAPANKRHHVAVLVANKIEEKGTDAQPYLRPAASEVRPRHKRAVIKELRNYNKKA